MTHDVHIVGSVPLRNTEDVLSGLSAALGPHLKRIPDGETGERLSWISWLRPVFAAQPALELTEDTFRVHEQATPNKRFALKKGASASEIRFDKLPYADFAIESYAVFRKLRDAGKIRPGTRFQVDYAPAHSAVRTHVVDALLPALEPKFNDAIVRDMDRIAAAIPHRELAFQFDAASAVFAVLQRGDFQAHGASKAEAAANFAKLLAQMGDRVPTEAELMFHFCYGDNNHRHSVEPIDMGDMVDMANRLRRASNRPINLIHMPVPRDRADDAYFAPLKNLDLAPETEIALGLVHLTGGIEGTKARLATARKYLSRFGIATECGFGRRKPETIPELLRIHAEAAELD
jgi:hypothetical protein